ncbi:hypothetical protein GWE18_12715 [Bradyrhizobium sp. CSA112]|uniref:hypothetical protein n=1 Tax=Bradyrhizobium sp. CSA112 TaxID=2699170 RepID=UPI0023AEBE41|nr:hypothetical protein [Bradyrhizobium sp. CSA112]MDE5453710.1 hypothetical protein [Bradyrhizobium sp. CSA112]
MAGTDGQALKVDCNMAQAFEFQRGDRTAYPGRLAIGSGVSYRNVSSNAFFQIAAPRSDPVAGSAPGIWVRRRIAASALTLPGAIPGRPDSRLGYPNQG